MDYGQLQAKVADYLNRNDLSTQIAASILLCVKDLETRHNWEYMRTSQAFTATTDSYLTLPTGYKEAICMYVTYDSINYAMSQISQPYMESVYISAGSTGKPEYYSINKSDSYIYVRPYPDTSYAYTLWYWKRSTELSASADTNWWTINHWDVVLAGTMVDLSMLIKDLDSAAIWQTRYEKAIAALRIAECQAEYGMGSVSANSVVV
jgi:hypothetical protein